MFVSYFRVKITVFWGCCFFKYNSAFWIQDAYFRYRGVIVTHLLIMFKFVLHSFFVVLFYELASCLRLPSGRWDLHIMAGPGSSGLEADCWCLEPASGLA